MKKKELRRLLSQYRSEYTHQGLYGSAIVLCCNSGQTLTVNWGYDRTGSELSPYGKLKKVQVGATFDPVFHDYRTEICGRLHYNVPLKLLAQWIEQNDGLDQQAIAERMLSKVELREEARVA